MIIRKLNEAIERALNEFNSEDEELISKLKSLIREVLTSLFRKEILLEKKFLQIFILK